MAQARAGFARDLDVATLEARSRELRAAMEAVRRELRAPVLLAATGLPRGFGHFAPGAVMTGGARFLEVSTGDDGMTHREVCVVDGRAVSDGVDLGDATAPTPQGRRRVTSTDGRWLAPLVARDRFVRPDSIVLPLGGPLVDAHRALAAVARHGTWLASTVGLYAARHDAAARELRVVAARIAEAVVDGASTARVGLALAA